MNSSSGGRWAWPLFLVLAYGITWTVQIPAYFYLVPRGIVPTNEANFLLFGELGTGALDLGTALAVLLLCFSFGPSLAGIVIVALVSGRVGLRNMFAPLARVRVPGTWIAFVLLFPLALSLVAVALGWMFGGMAPLDHGFLVPLALAVPFLVFLMSARAWPKSSDGGVSPCRTCNAPGRPNAPVGSWGWPGAYGTCPRWCCFP